MAHMSMLEAKADAESILNAMSVLRDKLEPTKAAGEVERAARIFFANVWAPLHRAVLNLQPGERVRFHCGDGNDALRSDGWREVIYVGPIEHDPKYAAIRETWQNESVGCSGWAEWSKLDRPLAS